MVTRRTFLKIAAGVIIAAALGGGAYQFFAAPKPKRPIKIVAGTPGSAAYTIAFPLVNVWKETIPEYEWILSPQAGFPKTFRLYDEGELDAAYGNGYVLKAYWRGTDWFKDYKPKRKKPVHTFYMFPYMHALFTLKDKPYETWDDLSGKPVFFYPSPWGNHREVMKMWEGLGLEANHVDVDFSLIPDALRTGKIEAFFAYSTGLAPVRYLVEVGLAVPLKMLAPPELPANIAKELAWTIYPNVSTKEAFGAEFGRKTILTGGGIYSPVITSSEVIPEEIVYRMIKSAVEAKDKIASIAPETRFFYKDPVDLQVRGIDSVPDIPVHPGLARFLKEKGAWKAEWKVET